MDARLKTLARSCFDGAEANTMSFPQIVGALSEGGFEGYLVDFRRGVTTYYLPDGDSFEIDGHDRSAEIAARLDVEPVKAAILEAQEQAAGYSYKGFCRKVKAAGVAGYMVSFSGRRAVYFGRDAVIHVEHFPGAD